MTNGSAVRSLWVTPVIIDAWIAIQLVLGTALGTTAHKGQGSRRRNADSVTTASSRKIGLQRVGSWRLLGLPGVIFRNDAALGSSPTSSPCTRRSPSARLPCRHRRRTATAIPHA